MLLGRGGGVGGTGVLQGEGENAVTPSVRDSHSLVIS